MVPEDSSVVDVMPCDSVSKEWIPQLYYYETLKPCEHFLFGRLICCAL